MIGRNALFQSPLVHVVLVLDAEQFAEHPVAYGTCITGCLAGCFAGRFTGSIASRITGRITRRFANARLEIVRPGAVLGQLPRRVLGQSVVVDEAPHAHVREFGKVFADLVHPGSGDLDGDEVGIGEVPVVVGFLLRPHGKSLPRFLVPQAGLAHDPASVVEHFGLPVDLERQGPFHGPHGVHVLDLDEFAQGIAGLANGHVGVAAQAALVHVAVADADVLQDLPQPGEVGRGFAGAADIGLAHDLHEGHARAVEVDVAQVGIVSGLVVDGLAGFFLQVDAPQSDESGAVLALDLDTAAQGDGFARPVVLRDLVALGQVRIEVVLAREGAGLRHVAVHGQRHADGVFDGAAVQDGQDAGHAEADGTHAAVRLAAEGHGTSAEDLRIRQELGVHFQPDYRLVVHGRFLTRRAGMRRFISLWSCRSLLAVSYSYGRVVSL